MSDRGCSHLDAIASVKQPQERECAECVKIGSSWVHLRTCQQCGVTLCCDSSPNRHASKHAQDRKSTRLNSSHSQISYAVFCLKKTGFLPTRDLPPEHRRLQLSGSASIKLPASSLTAVR